jgi:hypothetical protein
MTQEDQERLGKYAKLLKCLSQWACSESWEEIEEATDYLIGLITNDIKEKKMVSINTALASNKNNTSQNWN